jgi:hypothetical protein
MFWLSLGAFTLAEKLGLSGVDAFAAAAMNSTEARPSKKGRSLPVHWTVAEDDDWRWYEREHFIDGEWWLTGTTAPVNKKTAERKHEGNEAYLDDSLVPAAMLSSSKDIGPKVAPLAAAATDTQLPTSRRRNRHGPANGCEVLTPMKFASGSKRSNAPRQASRALRTGLI